MAVLLLAPILAAMPELLYDGGSIAMRLETYLDNEGTQATCRDLLLACAAKVGQVLILPCGSAIFSCCPSCSGDLLHDFTPTFTGIRFGIPLCAGGHVCRHNGGIAGGGQLR